MTDEQRWRPVLFQCPQTGHRVQGLIASDASSASDGDYETVSCIACSGVHFINARTGTVLGMSRDDVARPLTCASQAFSLESAARLRNRIRRDVSSTMVPDCASWVKVRDTVSMVNPR